jgi:hypothetical protein
VSSSPGCASPARAAAWDLASELAEALRRAGFAVRRLRGYGRLGFGPDQAGFAARRR